MNQIQNGRAITAATVRECCYKLRNNKKKAQSTQSPMSLQTVARGNAQLIRQWGSTLCLMEKKKIMKLHGIPRGNGNCVKEEESYGRDIKAGKSLSLRGRKKWNVIVMWNRGSYTAQAKRNNISDYFKTNQPSMMLNIAKSSSFKKYFLKANFFCNCQRVLGSWTYRSSRPH